MGVYSCQPIAYIISQLISQCSPSSSLFSASCWKQDMKKVCFLSALISSDSKLTSYQFPFWFPLKLLLLLLFCGKALTFHWGGAVKFNRLCLDSVDFTSLPAQKEFPFKRIQDYKGFSNSFFFSSLWRQFAALMWPELCSSSMPALISMRRPANESFHLETGNEMFASEITLFFPNLKDIYSPISKHELDKINILR